MISLPGILLPTRISTPVFRRGTLQCVKVGRGSNPPSGSLPLFLSSLSQQSKRGLSGTTRSHTIKSRLLENVHPLSLFRIVQDVDRYKEFLPLCSGSKVFRETIRDGGRSFDAELVVGYGYGFGSSSLFETRYVSSVKVDPEALRIETSSGTGTLLSDGTSNNDGNESGRMFDSLTSRWELRPAKAERGGGRLAGTVVDFTVEMTVSDPVVAAVLNQVLARVAESQVLAFSRRCGALPPPTEEELGRAERFYGKHGSA